MTEQEVWLRAWCATISASNCLSTGTATKAADICLDEYKDRFPEPELPKIKYPDEIVGERLCLTTQAAHHP